MIEKAILKKNAMPEYLTFFVTNRCNCRCSHCFFWREINKPGRELSLGEIEKVSKGMGKFRVLSLTGGEPLLRKDLFGIIKAFYDNCSIRNLVLPTNGTLPARQLVEKVLAGCPKLNVRVFVSLDALGKKHDKIRGVKGTFEKAVKTFKELKKIESKKFELGTITTFSTINQKEIFGIYDWLKQELQPGLLNFPVIRGKIKDESMKGIDVDVYEALMKKVCRETRGGLVKIAKDKMIGLNIRVLRENRLVTPCFAGTINAVMHANGDVFPCEILELKMGNVKGFDYDFKKLWFSADAKRVKKRIAEMKCFCTHGCNMLPNVIFNPRYYPGILLRLIKGKAGL